MSEVIVFLLTYIGPILIVGGIIVGIGAYGFVGLLEDQKCKVDLAEQKRTRGIGCKEIIKRTIEYETAINKLEACRQKKKGKKDE